MLHEIVEKCKSDEAFVAAVIILIGIGSFGLGRLSKIEGSMRGISIEAPAQVANVIMTEKTPVNANLAPKNDANTTNISQNDSIVSDTGSGQVVASKNGTKYYFPWCGGVKNIAEKNIVTFPSSEAARAAGYSPAANCKGLK